MSEPPLQLDYSTAEPWHRRPRVRKWLRILGVLIVVAALATVYGPSLSDRLHLLYWQNRLATLTLPSDFVVYREDGPPLPGSAGMTITRRPDHSLIVSKFSETRNRTSQIEHFPDGLDEFLRYSKSPQQRPIRNVPTYFIHLRRAGPGSRPRLVQVTGYPSLRLASPRSDGYYDSYPVLRAAVIRPATLTQSAAELSITTLPQPDLSFIPAGDLQLLAGQPDPNDESRFTLEYRTPTTRGVIQGKLLADDTVQLTLSTMPAGVSPPPAPSHSTSAGSSTVPATSPARPPGPAPSRP